MLKTATIFEFSLAVVAVLLGLWFDIDPLQTVAATDGLDWFQQTVSGGLLALPPLLILIGLCRFRFSSVLRINDWLRDQLGSMVQEAHWLDLATLSLAAGVGEEVLFRGLIQAGAAEYLGESPAANWAAITIASVAFGAMHWVTLTYFLYATLMGAFLGVVFLQSGQLWMVVVAHAVYDFLALLWLRRFWAAQKKAT